MLRRTPSLALRASLVFMLVYAATFLAAIGTSAAISYFDRGEGNQRGPVLAAAYAATELREAGGRLQIPSDGRFAKLASRNPSIWVIVRKGGHVSTAGAVPKPALAQVADLDGLLEPTLFRVRGTSGPLGIGALERRETEAGSIIVAAGGVDAATLSAWESLHLLLEPGIWIMLAVIAVVSLLTTLLAVPVFSRALRPIATEAAAIGPSDPGRRIEERKTPKELLPLVRALNAALDSLERELGRRKRFVADVAHELRTPLATLSLRIEGLADGPAREDLRRGLDRLAHLVSQMLDLERLSLSGPHRPGVDLAAIARDVVADMAPTAIAAGYDLSLVAPGSPVLVVGDGHAIARALTNLVGNAIVHGLGRGAIGVTLDDAGTIDVADEGPGVPPGLADRLFEPFARGTASAQGCGLGLHLAREIARAHGGDLVAVANDGGAIFRLSLPTFRPGQE